jgi:hypothetical protein
LIVVMRAGLAFGFLAAFAGDACASHGGSSAEAESPELRGSYVAADPNSDDGIVTFVPETSEYVLWTTKCPAGAPTPCLEEGHYVWNDARDTLELTTSTGQRRFLPARAEPDDGSMTPVTMLQPQREIIRDTFRLVRASPVGRLVLESRQLFRDTLAWGVSDKALEGKNVLLLPLEYSDEGSVIFEYAAKALRGWYGSHGATVRLEQLGLSPDSVYSKLEALRGSKFDRVVFLAHGGLDGPLWSKTWEQIGLNWPNAPPGGPRRHDDGSVSYLSMPDPPPETIRSNRAALDQLFVLLRDVTADDGFIYVGACHSAGRVDPNEGESVRLTSNVAPEVSFIQLTACATGRTTYGTRRTTSGENITANVQQLDSSNLVVSGIIRADPGDDACAHTQPP